jgi:hypothetical protein
MAKPTESSPSNSLQNFQRMLKNHIAVIKHLFYFLDAETFLKHSDGCLDCRTNYTDILQMVLEATGSVCSSLLTRMRRKIII